MASVPQFGLVQLLYVFNTHVILLNNIDGLSSTVWSRTVTLYLWKLNDTILSVLHNLIDANSLPVTSSATLIPMVYALTQLTILSATSPLPMDIS